MSGFRQFDSLERVSLPAGPVFLAIGMFDGVHRGHQAVIRTAVEAARAANGLAGVLTFWPHPVVVLRPEQPLPLILTREAKRAALARLGIDFLVEHPFTREFAATSAEGFLSSLTQAFPGLRGISVGENFRFGRAREGDGHMLAAAARESGFTVSIAPRLASGNQPISSSRLRTLIAAGDFVQANELLGYTYSITGVVEQGRQLGRELGFPTLNLRWEPVLRPPYGVYAVRVGDDPVTALPAVANYGLRPTVDEGAVRPLLEVHLLDDPAPDYGATIRVWWGGFLRAERKFADLAALRAQVELDRENARIALEGFSPQEIAKSA